ncbi:unnamed protein product [Cuscuta europaea]|uniref:DUF641 domain-containing protein n=1 Tax=Cuscuta europaea TaxID=41803 RepID=A0A9P0YR74_CUSEU|nr:unnamed protein product [Cuscuta europaea]
MECASRACLQSNACKYRSIGVFGSENQLSLNNAKSKETEEAESYSVKVHPLRVEVHSKVHIYGHLVILKLFEAISALKLTYINLQKAHIPYEPDKIRAADEAFSTQLVSLSKIRRAYEETKKLKELKSAETQVQEKILDKLKSLVKDKEYKIISLQKELHDVYSKNKKLAKELKNVKVLSFSHIEKKAKAASKAIHDFSKPLITLMKVTGWDLDEAAHSIQPSVVYSNRSHKKHAFEAYISQRMFLGFTSSFFAYCSEKYLSIVHPVMEVAFFGNLDHNTLVSNGFHPATSFYSSFSRMARSVWELQCDVAYVGATCEMFGVKRGSKFSNVYMESVEEVSEERSKVGLMVMPGFIFGDGSIIKSRVYV